jgi:predicted chitinase
MKNQYNFYFYFLIPIILSNYLNSQSFPCTNDFGSKKYNGTCKLVEECVGAALQGNCQNTASFNFICCIPDSNQPNLSDKFITKPIFLKVAGNTSRNSALYGFFVQSMQTAKINDQNKAASYFATLLGESNFFRELESKVKDQDFNADLGNNSTNDGSIYRGRGAILVRGKTNYQLAESKLKLNLINFPELGAFPSKAFQLAAWFWTENAFIIRGNQTAKKGNLNELADGTFHSFTLLTHSLTNDLTKLKDRATLNEKILMELNFISMKRGQGIDCTIGVNKTVGFSVPICMADFKRQYCGCEGEFDIRSCPYGQINNSTKCRSSSIIKCCVEKCSNQLDNVKKLDFFFKSSNFYF